MKTKPTSLRFDENDLVLAINKSGIKKTQKLMDFLLSEYVRNLKPQYLSFPEDIVISEKIGAVNKAGVVVVKNITKAQPQTDYTINTINKDEILKQISELEEKIKTVPPGQYYNKIVKTYKDQIYRLKNSCPK